MAVAVSRMVFGALVHLWTLVGREREFAQGATASTNVPSPAEMAASRRPARILVQFWGRVGSRQ